MPKVDMVMDDGTFVEWLKREGDHVKKGEPLFVILTDKANIEIESPANGILRERFCEQDDEVEVGDVIAIIDDGIDDLDPGDDEDKEKGKERDKEEDQDEDLEDLGDDQEF